MYVYQIAEKYQDREGNSKVRYHGYYKNESAAQDRIKSYEFGRMNAIAHKIARMIGWKRGRNAQAFQDAVHEMANSPYSIKKISVDTSWR